MERWSLRVGFALFSFLLIGRVWLFEVVSVANDSMSPALRSGELVLVWRGPLARVEPGAIVLYEHSGVRSLKRVVAQSGQTVEVSSGGLFVDGVAARQEDAVIALSKDCRVSEVAGVIEQWGGLKAAVRPAGEAFSEQVPPGHVYILGDHRAESSDSRQWGPLPESTIRGVAGWVLWSDGGCDSARRLRIGERVR